MREFIRRVGLICVFGSLHCGPASEVALTCDDIYPEAGTSFVEVSEFLGQDCGMCHSKTNPVYGYDFSTPQAAYLSTRYKAHKIYEQMVTGQMPLGGTLVDDEFLKAFRSWYCRGGVYDGVE